MIFRLMRWSAVTAMMCLCLATVGCERFGAGRVVGSGIRKTETRRVDAFEEVKLVGAFKVEINIAPQEPLTIAADDNLLPLIETVVRNGRLTIRTIKSYRSKNATVIKVTAGNIRFIGGAGAGKITLSEVKNETLTIDLIGGYSLTASGKTNELKLSVTGAGDIDAANLIAKGVDVSLTGAGNADVYASERHNIQITGAGAVSYRGEPTVTQTIFGAGRVQSKGR